MSPPVEQRGTATARRAQRAFDAVALVHLDQVLTDAGLLVLDDARREDRHPALRFDDRHRRATREPRGEPLPGEERQQSGRRDAGERLDDLADERARLGTDDPVGDG